ncbi:hypothetical protein A3Q56_02167 [Intoshia linei]|uniref:Uncharacterized protein n=1 Tax=Intoshia linei TaxID=1819745 RepID=A0A177B709_9BILA|nr:hypothetical protein A3Q56_02167 [Intoshia linei]
MENVGEMSRFFSFSCKRQDILTKALDKYPAIKAKKLKDVCKTWWIQRIDSLNIFYEMYEVIMEVMQEIFELKDNSSTKATVFLIIVKNCFQNLYAKEFAFSLNIEEKKPRCTKRQANRANIEGSDIETELSLQFFSGEQIFLKGFSLHPTYFKTCHFEDLRDFAEKYELFLPCISLV